MSHQALSIERGADLRSRAACRLSGSADAKGPVARAADALAVLYGLASSPATAADALALLHELQVHQVELDLQAEELRDSRAALESALQRQLALHDALPAACFTVDRHLRVLELNPAGARLLGSTRDAAQGLRLDQGLSADGARQLHAALSTVAEGATQASCTLQWMPPGGPSRRVRADIGAAPTGPHFLAVLTAADAAMDRPHENTPTSW